MSDSYFTSKINKKAKTVEITESGETMELDWDNFEDYAKCIQEAYIKFMKAKNPKKPVAKSKAVEKLMCAMDMNAEKDFNVYRIDHTATSLEFKNSGRGKNAVRIFKMTMEIKAEDLYVDPKEKGDLGDVMNIDLLTDNSKLKMIPLLVIADNTERI